MWLDRAIEFAVHIFVTLVRLIFWVPILTVDFADERIIPRERTRCGATIIITWLITIGMLLSAATGPYPWKNMLIVTGVFHYGLGLMFILLVMPYRKREHA